MRKPEYMSPSSMKIFYEDRERYYMEYLSDTKKIRDLQTIPMAIGSAFDAYVKSELYSKLVNKGDKQFTFDALFESQVETQNRSLAKIDGKKVYDFYVSCGAMADLLLDMQGCIGEPRFETKIEGKIRLNLLDIPLLGKPDIFFLTKDGARIIFDWKVNGYYSKAAVSPKPGYMRIRPGGDVHKNFWPIKHEGYTVNCQCPFEDTDKEWAAQLSTYGWLLGEPVGGKTVLAVDQIVCNNSKGYMRVAQHRGIASHVFQLEVFKLYEKAWNILQTGHIFDDLPREESDAKCRLFDSVSNTLNTDPAFKACL